MKKWLAKSLVTALLGISVASFAFAESNTTTTTDTTGTEMNSTATGTGMGTDSSTMTTTPATTTDTTVTTTVTPATSTGVMTDSTMEKKSNGKHHKKMSKNEIMMMPAGDVKWVEPPASMGFSPGMQIAYLDQNNLRSSAPFAFLVKIPANSKEQPHTHPAKMQGVIMSGTYYLGIGKEFDESKGTALPAGSFYAVPAKKAYYGWNQDEVVILVHSMGPWSTRMVSVNGEHHNGKKHHKNGTATEKNMDSTMSTGTNGDSTNMTTQPTNGTTDTSTGTGSGSSY